MRIVNAIVWEYIHRNENYVSADMTNKRPNKSNGQTEIRRNDNISISYIFKNFSLAKNITHFENYPNFENPIRLKKHSPLKQQQSRIHERNEAEKE